ncbi:MAG: DUF1425 domain-containing protein [Planctomycetes bacterium]|nr:DUF1425 domain-containing protein [Planctomycetota bacterium]
MNTLRLLFLSIPFLFLGCATQAANSITVAPDVSSQIEVFNSGLHDDCEITSGSALYEDKLLSTHVTLQSHLDEKIALEGRWSWEDAQGYPIKANRAWKTVFVNAQEERKIEGLAPGPQAISGKYELRYHSGETND